MNEVPLTRATLDKWRCPCGASNCEELFLKGKCHPKAGADAVYNQQTGVLSIRCSACDGLIVNVQVAS